MCLIKVENPYPYPEIVDLQLIKFTLDMEVQLTFAYWNSGIPSAMNTAQCTISNQLISSLALK